MPNIMDYMRGQSIGIEIEFIGISRARAAQVIADHFGTRVEYRPGAAYDARFIPDATGRKWKIVSDASIAANYENQCEFVSPICYYDDIPTIQEIVRKLRAAGAKPDDSCGIHVHIGRGNHTAATLRNLVKIVNAKEDLLTMALEISRERRDTWCKPVESRFIELLDMARPRDMDQFARAWYAGNPDRLGNTDIDGRPNEHYDYSRYHLLNLHAIWQKGTIEFRAFNSTLHAGRVKSYIQLCLAISAAALNATSASAARPNTDNPKYAFRCWLLKLGLIGDEFETARKLLIEKLPGDAAFRHGRPAAMRA